MGAVVWFRYITIEQVAAYEALGWKISAPYRHFGSCEVCLIATYDGEDFPPLPTGAPRLVIDGPTCVTSK